MQLKDKLTRLQKIISGYGSCLVAFSGGLDSSFLLKVVSLTLPKGKVLAVTAESPTYPAKELAFARRFCRKAGIRHKVIRTHELNNARFVANTPQRCYFCKKELFARLKGLARADRLSCVLDASNLSDRKDFRPGAKAKRELGVRSPLQEAGIGKSEIRRLSRRLSLETWDKPASACLASRIPYGSPITKGILARVDKAEEVLKGLKFGLARVRDYGRLSRIEVDKKDILRLLDNSQSIVDKFKKLGYNYVTVDLEGYRTGSLNEVIGK